MKKRKIIDSFLPKKRHKYYDQYLINTLKRKKTNYCNISERNDKKLCKYIELANVTRRYMEIQYCRAFGYGEYRCMTQSPNVLEIYS